MRKLLFVIICSLGCNTAPAESPVPGTLEASGEVVTTVNGEPITQGMIDATLALLPEHIQKQIEMTGQQDQVKEQMVLGELLYREALKRDLHKDSKVQTTIALSAREALAQTLLEAIIDERATDEAMEKWYQDHILKFTKNEVDVSHILVKEEALINKIKAQLDKGADFAALASEHSLDPGSKARGGRLGPMPRGKTVPQFEQAAFSTAEGKYSNPVKSQFGWHIVLVHKKINENMPLADVKEDVKKGLSQELIRAYFEEIKEGATIVESGADKAGEGEGGKAKSAKKKSKGKLQLRPGKAGKKAGKKAAKKAGKKAAKKAGKQ